MPRKPTPNDARARFARCLEAHRQAGTRPGCLESEPWSYADLAAEIQSPRLSDDFASPRSISNWCKGKSLPSEIEPLLNVFFGKTPKEKAQVFRNRLRRYYLSAKKEKTVSSINKSKRDHSGGSWIIENEQFVLDRSVRNTDRRAAADPLRTQLQKFICKIVGDLKSQSIRVGNSPIWKGLTETSSRLHEILKLEPNQLCENLGELYALFLAAGQYLETDNRVQKDKISAHEALDPQIHGILSNFINISAPWLRGFPTVAAWDSAAGRTLVQKNLFEPVKDFNQIAHDERAISDRDAAEIAVLVGASDEENFQGRKAGARAVGDVKNLIVASAEAVIKSSIDPNVHPLHVQRAISTLKAGQIQVEEVANYLQPDLRNALLQIIKDLTRSDHEYSMLKTRIARIPSLSRQDLDRIGGLIRYMYKEDQFSSPYLTNINVDDEQS